MFPKHEYLTYVLTSHQFLNEICACLDKLSALLVLNGMNCILNGDLLRSSYPVWWAAVIHVLIVPAVVWNHLHGVYDAWVGDWCIF